MNPDEKNKDIQSTKPIDEEDGTSRKLDEKLMELQSLFEVSQTLNSSLNLRSILDNMLLTPMGKMMITRGIVLLYTNQNELSIETSKGLQQDFQGKKIFFEHKINEPTFLDQLDSQSSPGFNFFKEVNIVILLPIRSRDKTLGLLGFGTKISHKPYSKSEIEFLKSLSNIAATSIENGIMVMKLKDVNRRLDKKIQELNTLFDIGKELNSTLDTNKILNLLSYAVMGEMIINKCLIFTKEKTHMKLAMAKGHRNENDLLQFGSEELLGILKDIKIPIHFKDENPPELPISILYNSGYRLVVPMRIQNETKGILAIGDRINKVDFQDYDIEFLSTLGNEAMICLENARLFEEMLEKQRMEEELAIAREIQQNLLPRTYPTLEKYEIAAINVSSQHVSGDYFDCIQLNSHRICLAIADVSGKGTGASLLMANLQAVLHALIDSDSLLIDIVSKINNLIHRNTHYDKFITFFIGILDTEKNNFTYVNAGHNPPILLNRKREVMLLETGGLLLGMMPNVPYQQETIPLYPGEWIVMFTDGVTEAVNTQDEEFEEHRLIDVIKENRSESAEVMKEKILKSVRNFSRGCPQSDDITLLNLKILD